MLIIVFLYVAVTGLGVMYDSGKQPLVWAKLGEPPAESVKGAIVLVSTPPHFPPTSPEEVITVDTLLYELVRKPQPVRVAKCFHHHVPLPLQVTAFSTAGARAVVFVDSVPTDGAVSQYPPSVFVPFVTQSPIPILW